LSWEGFRAAGDAAAAPDSGLPGGRHRPHGHPDAPPDARCRAEPAARRHDAPAVDDPEVCRAARGGAFVTDSRQDWLDAYAEQCRAAASPDGFLRPTDLRSG